MQKKIVQNKADDDAFTGIWRSHYVYHHKTRKVDTDDEHYVRMYRTGKELVVETIPGLHKSYFIMRLTQVDRLLTGTWQQETDTEGDYGGTTFYGAIQLIIDDAEHMHGKWVGFVAEGLVDTGPLDLTYVGEKLPSNSPTGKPLVRLVD